MRTAQREGRPIAADDPRADKTNQTPIRKAHAQRIAQKRRRAKCKRIALALPVLAVVVAVIVITTSGSGSGPAAVDITPEQQLDAIAPGIRQEQLLASVTPAAETEAPPATPTPSRYELTASERDTVERVVMAEAGGEDYEGQMLVAQCILNAAEHTGKDPLAAMATYQYAAPADSATQSVKDAVAAVFDAGETVTDEPILFFYAPRWATSTWHESQIFVLEHGGHRFFAERGASQ